LVAHTTRNTPAYGVVGDVSFDGGGVRAISFYHDQGAALVSRVDALLLLAVAQDICAGRGLHRAYAISLPLVVSGQIAAMWLYLARPTWWVEFAQHLF
jgi:hypothetical protein